MSQRLLVLTFAVAAINLAHAADRAEITFADTRVFPESITSTRDGTLYIGSLARGGVYRAGPNSTRAELWIKPCPDGPQGVLGVLADEATRTLWVCKATVGPTPRDGATAAEAFSLSDGSLKTSYRFPGHGLLLGCEIGTTVMFC